MDRVITRLKGRQKLYRSMGDKLFDEGSSKMARAWWQRAEGIQEAIDVLEELKNEQGKDENGEDENGEGSL